MVLRRRCYCLEGESASNKTCRNLTFWWFFFFLFSLVGRGWGSPGFTFTKSLSKELCFCLSWLILTHTSPSTRVVFQTKVVYQAKFFASKQDVYQVGLIPKRTYTEVPNIFSILHILEEEDGSNWTYGHIFHLRVTNVFFSEINIVCKYCDLLDHLLGTFTQQRIHARPVSKMRVRWT
jgi:hypothetical protein